MNKLDFTYQNFLYNLEHNIPFSFARYGDGEFNAILGTKKPHKIKNCDNHRYFADMGFELSEIIKGEPEYILGMQNLALRVRGEEIESFIEGLDIKWCNADILHNASIKGKMSFLFNALNNLNDRVVVIGPHYLKDIKEKFDYKYFVEVPQVDCWIESDRIINECAKILVGNPNMILLFSGSMAANVWIDSLYKHFGQDHSFLDCGSVWDPYVGQNKRSYHKQILAREAKQKKTS